MSRAMRPPGYLLNRQAGAIEEYNTKLYYMVLNGISGWAFGAVARGGPADLRRTDANMVVSRKWWNEVVRTANVMRPLGLVCGVGLLLLVASAAAGAEPTPPAPNSGPYPDLRYFDRADPDAFTIPGADGVWFTAPEGQNCGIWAHGNFGCAGDISGAPPGVSRIGWYDGDHTVHYDWSVAIRFPGTVAQLPLPPHQFISYEGTTCAVTFDRKTYCARGPMRFVIEPDRTWLN